ncbi:hypothetical protein MBA34_23910 [Pseudomonas capeferrum]|uniref:hypothetical protein n=1 Tax=Pseudomonas capeferrum TaxID=1495066 RepID=UPI0004D8964F|nr:hypothetical protein [Pseudomonas capeferrum]KEY88851.1 hypothetical protein PC358_06890 [Pseudomonas capeferrum]MCH7302055.1 hypothetical protein [Pseudomonas capeferrum]
MTTDMLAGARKSYLLSIKDPNASTGLLNDLLDRAEKQTPELLLPFEPGVGKNALDLDPVSWSADYLTRQMWLTQQNFARERIEHLLAVREHLRKTGVKGFVPTQTPSEPQTESDVNVQSNYEPSSNLRKFVQEGELLTIRTALRMELDDNRLTSADLRAALTWAVKQVPALLEAYSEKSFARAMESDQKLWTSEYYELQVVYLKTNYAQERFLHLIEVRDLLRHQGVDGFAPVQPKPRASASANAGQAAPASHRPQPQNSRSQQSHQANQGHQSQPRAADNDRKPVFKAALLVGGALAALVVFLVALVK